LQELKRPTAKIEDVFKRVRLNVRKQSNGRQIPWESTSLEDDFFFNDGIKYTIKPEDLERMAASALANAGDKDRAAEIARLAEIQRLAALTTTPAPKLNKEQAQALAFAEAKAAWDAIKGSKKADDFYGFLLRFPSSGEFAESAQYQLDQLATSSVVASLGKGQDASLGYRGPRYKVGDVFEFQVTDALTKVQGEKYASRVTSIEGDIVKLNNGNAIFTVLGGVIKHRTGTFDPPLGGLPVELQVGKKWSGRSANASPDGNTYQLQLESKIIGRETVTVPAGTFQTYVIRSTMYSSSGSTFSRTFWVDPRYGASVKWEDIGRNSRGQIFRSDRHEMVALKADRS